MQWEYTAFGDCMMNIDRVYLSIKRFEGDLKGIRNQLEPSISIEWGFIVDD
jgi:hypothetical protein